MSLSTLPYFEEIRYPEDFFAGADIALFLNDQWVEDVSALAFSVVEVVEPRFSYAGWIPSGIFQGARYVQGQLRMPMRTVHWLKSLTPQRVTKAETTSPSSFQQALDKAQALLGTAPAAKMLPVLRPGARGSEVTRLQSLLSAHGIVIPNEQYAWPTLAPGDRSPDVTELQERLRQLGFPPGEKGVLDAATERQVKRVQELAGLPITGVVDSATRQALESGFRISGQYDLLTFAAVSRFQALKGIRVDGICGPQTWTALGVGQGAVEVIHTPTEAILPPSGPLIPGVFELYIVFQAAMDPSKMGLQKLSRKPGEVMRVTGVRLMRPEIAVEDPANPVMQTLSFVAEDIL